MDDFYANQEYVREDYDTFINGVALGEFVKVADKSELEFVRYDGYAPLKANVVDLTLRYIARYDEGGKQKEMVLRVVMRRKVDPNTGECGWIVNDVLPETKRT